MFGEAKTGAAKILLVDDDIDTLDYLSLALLRHGFILERATSGNDALKAIQTPPQPDIIISDYKMPNGDGLELVKCLKDMQAPIPVIWMSGNVSAFQYR